MDWMSFRALQHAKKLVVTTSSALYNTGDLIWADIIEGRATDHPMLLTRSLVLSFAMIKEHRYLYWFAFPAVVPAALQIKETDPVVSASSVFSAAKSDAFLRSFDLFFGERTEVQVRIVVERCC